MKSEQIVELIDKLITERLKLHLLNTSKAIGENLDKRPFVVDFERKISQIKASLVESLKA